jgi:septal ring factor EnvC (AmiA/AmiB activator)
MAEVQSSLDESSDSAGKMADLEAQLNDAADEIDRLKRKMKEMDAWKDKLERESKLQSLVRDMHLRTVRFFCCM